MQRDRRFGQRGAWLRGVQELEALPPQDRVACWYPPPMPGVPPRAGNEAETLPVMFGHTDFALQMEFPESDFGKWFSFPNEILFCFAFS